MATMYETIMNLPLFKGLSHEQISSFLEKTHIRFSKFNDGEQIVSSEDNVTNVKCIISGNVRMYYKFGEEDAMSLAFTERGENILGADKMFGLDNRYGFTARARGPVSLMEFSKDQYLNQLIPGSIYLLNYLNFLSLRAQIRYRIFADYPQGGLITALRHLVSCYCSKISEDISIAFDINDLAKFMNTDIDSATRDILELERKGIIKLLPDGFAITDNELF